jgi:nucleotide-binding universal stress UspA family protein
MPPIGELTILIPVDISESDLPALEIIDALRPFEVVLLGYFPVPDQAEPALIKHEYEDEAATRLDRIAEGRTVTEVLVFTHDREATIDRVADQYDCDGVLTAGDTDHIDSVLVPVRGDANVERIVSVVAGLLGRSDATATFFHSVVDDAEPGRSQGEFLLRGAVERLTEYGIDEGRVDWDLSEEGDPSRNIVTRGDEYDIVVLGETEPSIRERIIGSFLSDLIDELEIPALIVRDVE